MAVNLSPAKSLLPVPGITVGVAEAAVKYANRADIAIVFTAEKSLACGVFTQSGFAAAPVQISRKHLLLSHAGAAGPVRALVINSGNANAATGPAGLEDAMTTCEFVATALGLKTTQVLPFSTGVIGERLPMLRIEQGIERACSALRPDGWLDVASAIMTTDTMPKGLSRQIELSGQQITITGVVKGSGMIRPNMATMLAFISMDANISQTCLDDLLSVAVEKSFNRITVDGDTSTNDSLMLLSSCEAQNPCINTVGDSDYKILGNTLNQLCIELAQNLIRDAEGATHFIAVHVLGGANTEECLQVAYAIAESPLVKTALFANDPNWGRFCMAIGRAGLKDLDQGKVSLYVDNVCIAKAGELDAGYDEAEAALVMQKPEYTVQVELGRGDVSETIWTSDLSYEYVKINAEYRT